MKNTYLLRCTLFALLMLFAAVCPLFAGVSWTSNGPNYKVVKALAISPQDTNVIYAGAFGWGVFKSTDGGANWVSVKAGLTNAYVRSLVAISSTTVFCGTNDGVFKTTNGGTSWTISVATPFSVRGLAYDGASNHLFAATYGSGLYMSVDQGSTWSTLTVNDPVSGETLSHQWSVALFGVDSLYVGGSILDIGNGGALFRSTTGGATWSQVQQNVGIRSSVRSIAVSPTNPDLSLIIGTAAKGVYKSTNGGTNWTEINGATTPNPLPDLQVDAAGFSSLYRYAGTDSLGGFYLRALGDTALGWLTGSGLPGPLAHVSSMTINPTQPNALLLGTEGEGVYRSTSAGITWTRRSNGMLGTAPRVIRRNGDGRIFAGMEFGDGLWISSNQGVSWSAAAVGTSNAITSIGITNTPSVAYAGAYGSGVLKSTDAGNTWGVTDTTVINHFIRTVSVDPANASRVFAGSGNGVYLTTDGGATWSARNTGIQAGTSIRSMALDPVNTNILYAGTDSLYMYKTTDGGSNWTHITSANGFLPQDVFIRSVTIDYAAHTTLYAGSDSGRIYKSVNGGSTWALHAELPIVHSVRSVLIHPNDHKVFFCATFGDGIFASADSGAHWAAINTGLADLEFYTLESDQAIPLMLYAGSGMHGVYRTPYTFINRPPVLSLIGNKNVLAGSSLSFVISATDSDATFPLLTHLGLPSGAVFTDSANGRALFTWTPTIGQIGSYSLTVVAADGALADSEQITISVLDPGSSAIVPIQVEAGWNILSVPVIAADFRKSVLFSTATSSAFAYTGGYAVRETLSNGVGYWLKYPSAQSFTFGGGPVAQETVAVRTGWNIIGSLSSAVPVASVAPVAPVTITGSIFGFSGLSGYSTADSIRPGSGYWLKANQAGSIVISSGPIAESSARIRPVASSTLQEELSYDLLSFADQKGRQRSLALITAPSAAGDQALAELPPVPPLGGFDVRFSVSDRRAERIPAGTTERRLPIEITSPAASLTMSWDIRSADVSYSFVLEGQAASSVMMQGRGSITIPVSRQHVAAELIARRSAGEEEAVPGRIALEQNYPNPFNPSTLIRFEIPVRGTVSLKVFDVLGREIATLTSEELPAGAYARTWDAGALGSGVYYYRLDVAEADRPGSVSRQVKKMFLVK